MRRVPRAGARRSVTSPTQAKSTATASSAGRHDRAIDDHAWFLLTERVLPIIGQNAARAGEPEQLADPRRRHLPPEVVAAWMPPGTGTPAAGTDVDPAAARRALEVGAEMTLAMQRAGALVLAGTDLGLPYILPGFSLHDELGLLVEAGLSPLEALQAATRNAAAAVGRGDDRGTVEVGKLADLVVLNTDPLADIANTTRIAAVVANGRLLDGADLDALLTLAAPAATPVATPAP